jgi:hypothetical protein
MIQFSLRACIIPEKESYFLGEYLYYGMVFGKSFYLEGLQNRYLTADGRLTMRIETLFLKRRFSQTMDGV